MGVAYVPVARVGELGPGERKAVDLGGRSVVVTNIDGEYFAFGAQCPHEGAELELADITGTELRCDGHSYRYDLRSGQCVMPPGSAPLAVLPVEQRDDDICIRLEW
jgi:3-phenylpropionate/trans-cinnamate dioxygenase ferredoxin subunit